MDHAAKQLYFETAITLREEISKLKKKYPKLNINRQHFYNWQNDFIYDMLHGLR